jgi:hypothetical protein
MKNTNAFIGVGRVGVARTPLAAAAHPSFAAAPRRAATATVASVNRGTS